MKKMTPLIECEQELDIETVLREEFDENDFWENKILRNQLINEHQLLFKKKMENNFYRLFMMYLDDYPNMFENLDFDEMFNILYSCVIKNYNIETQKVLYTFSPKNPTNQFIYKRYYWTIFTFK